MPGVPATAKQTQALRRVGVGKISKGSRNAGLFRFRIGQPAALRAETEGNPLSRTDQRGGRSMANHGPLKKAERRAVIPVKRQNGL